jgi:hypothetical protein
VAELDVEDVGDYDGEEDDDEDQDEEEEELDGGLSTMSTESPAHLLHCMHHACRPGCMYYCVHDLTSNQHVGCKLTCACAGVQQLMYTMQLASNCKQMPIISPCALHCP